MPHHPDQVTALLHAWTAGDLAARDRLMSVVYRDLHRRAAAYLRRERPGDSLSPTALVHEAYLRLVDQRRVAWKNRGHFYGVAAQMMRRILVDRARTRNMAKRSGQWARVTVDDAAWAMPPLDVDILDRDAEERAGFLAEACAGDELVKHEVESMLAQPMTTDGLLDRRAVLAAAHQMEASIPTGRRLGPYEIEARIGSGGMGQVYRARDTKLERAVAIKILPRLFTADPERVARFEREARMLAALNHPNIGAIYGFEEAEDVRGLVLELVPGETLAARLGRGRIAVAGTLAIAGQIADALDAAHEKGIVHRDLKPANINLTPYG